MLRSKSLNLGALCRQSQAAAPLLAGADSQVSDCCLHRAVLPYGGIHDLRRCDSAHMPIDLTESNSRPPRGRAGRRRAALLAAKNLRVRSRIQIKISPTIAPFSACGAVSVPQPRTTRSRLNRWPGRGARRCAVNYVLTETDLAASEKALLTTTVLDTGGGRIQCATTTVSLFMLEMQSRSM
jgi:hypothetical protein